MKIRQTATLSVTWLLLFVVAAFNFMTFAKAGNNQPQYSEVVEKAFHFSEGIPAEFQGIESRIVIRYLPAFAGSEWQIVALRQQRGTYRVIRYGLKPGTDSISERYNKVLQQNPSATADEILRELRVEITDQKVDKTIVQLFDELDNLSIPAKLSSDLCTDGMTYELWAQTPSNEIHASLSDCAYGKNTDSAPIIRWMRSIGAKFQERK